MNPVGHITFPPFSGIRCLMMPYIQGAPESVPDEYAPYRDIVANTFVHRGDVGFLTIDESLAKKGSPHRGSRAKFDRALHTEAGRDSRKLWAWGGGGGWGGGKRVLLDRGVRILLANNVDGSCAVWDAEHENTSDDGDLGHLSEQYPFDAATFLKAGEVFDISILTPHESLPVQEDVQRQFLRIVSSGVHGREAYFTRNPLVNFHE